MSDQVFKLPDTVFALKAEGEDAIPAVEMDVDAGVYHVLVFTDMETARRFCYHRFQGKQLIAMREKIFALDARNIDGKLVHSELIRIARRMMARYPQIAGFLFDHNGFGGEFRIAATDDIAYLGMKKPEQLDKLSGKELHDFLNTQADEDPFKSN